MNESLDQFREEFKDEEYRYSYAEDFLNTWVATQIITLREQRKLNQIQLGQLIGTKQPGVSRLENVNHSNWKVDTLKRIARALGVRLNISFETFGTLIDQDNKFSREYLKRPAFKEDPVFSAETIKTEATLNKDLPDSLVRKVSGQDRRPNRSLNVIEFPKGVADRTINTFQSESRRDNEFAINQAR